MPELPEVETVRRGLLPVLRGERLDEVVVRRSTLRFPLPTDFAARLRGRRVTDIARRGKYLLIHLDNGLVWLAHLGMSGRMQIYPGERPALDAHDHVVVTTRSGAQFRFNDARRFGMMDLVGGDELGTHRLLRHLGPEPLGNGLDAAILSARLAGKQTSIKAALMDQRIVAGVGNIYACETLYWAGLSPRRRAASVVGKRAANLLAALRRVLEEAIAAGGSSLRDYRHADGGLGYFQACFAVYDRADRPCPRCSTDACRVRRIVQSGRSTFYCARHQR